MPEYPLQPGCMLHQIACKVPSAETTAFEAFLTKHEAFMRETHQRQDVVGAEPQAMVYFWAKAAEPADPSDPSKGNTDFSLYGLTECYRGQAGCDAHLSLAKAKVPELLEEFSAIVGPKATSWVTFAPVTHTLADPCNAGTLGCKTGKMSFQLFFEAVKGSDGEEEMDAFCKDHTDFMNETHTANGTGKEPSPLYFAWSKNPKWNDPFDTSKGATDKIVYSLTEVYNGKEGCDAHMAAGKATGPLFDRFLGVVGKYAVQTGMYGDLIRSF